MEALFVHLVDSGTQANRASRIDVFLIVLDNFVSLKISSVFE